MGEYKDLWCTECEGWDGKPWDIRSLGRQWMAGRAFSFSEHFTPPANCNYKLEMMVYADAP